MSNDDTAPAIPLHTRPGRAAHSLRAPAGADDVVALLGLDDDIDHTIPYQSDIWDLAGHPAWKGKVGAQTAINFTEVEAYWRPLVKLWALCSLDPEGVAEQLDLDPLAVMSVFREAAKPVTVQGNVKAAKNVLGRLAAAGLYEIAWDDWDRATAAIRSPHSRAAGVASKTLTTRTAIQWSNQIVALDRFGAVAGWEDPFGSPPWQNQLVSHVFKATGSEKQQLNAVRPTEAVGAVLGVAAFVIDELADDILTHLEWWRSRLAGASPPAGAESAREALCELYITIAEANGGKVPGVVRNGQLAVAHQAMCDLVGGVTHLAPAPASGRPPGDKATPLSKFAVKRAEAALGYRLVPDTSVTPCPLTLRTFPSVTEPGTVVPWASRLLWERAELRWWVSALLYAVAYYLQATVGLRDLDRDLLAVGCVKRKVINVEGEAVPVWELHAWKQKQLAVPTKTTFAVAERVARAVEMVERLHTLLDVEAPEIDGLPERGHRRLFASDLNVGSARGGREAIHLDLGYMRWFRAMAERLHAAGVVPQDLSDVPDVTSQEVRITAMQAYADRTLGQALSASYGKWTTSRVMRGYIGDVAERLVFVADADAEGVSVEARAQHLVELAANEATLSGNGVSKLATALESHRDVFADLDLANPEPLTKAQLRQIGKTERNLEVGPYTHCFFDPAHALCGGRGSADFRLCRPGACHNSVMTRGQRAAVELRRRALGRLHPSLARDRAKIDEDLDADLADLGGLDDAELRAIIDDEVDRYLTRAVGAPKRRLMP